MSAAPDAPPGPGDILGGRYRLIRELGQGGMGVVYLAESTVDQESFAVKVLGAEFRDHPDAIAALREEARKSLTLRHPNIVAVYPLERDAGTYYLPMEYLDGKTLRALLDEDFVRGMPLQQAWSIIHGIGSALAFAHDRGVIHSDLKPSNIFVTVGGSARVLDFGIARAMRGGRQRFDTTTLGALTTAYASKEMIAGNPPDFQDDIYGFACVVHELLTGRHPFGGRSAADAESLGLKLGAVPGISEAQQAALRRGLAFRKEERCASIEEFVGAWDRLGAPRMAAPPRTPLWIGLCVAAAIIAGLAWWWVSPALHRAAAAPAPVPSPPPAATTTTAANAPTALAARPASGLPVPGTEFRDCADCPAMVVLPAGQFRLSSSREEPERGAYELPQRLVQIPRPFAIGEYPVTRAQFRAFLAATGHQPGGLCGEPATPGAPRPTFETPGYFQTEQDPAVCVSIGDALAYAAWLNRKTGSDGAYRLPNEAEWEFAARADSHAPYAWGPAEADGCSYGNFAGCGSAYRNTAPVGRFKRNAFGLADMIGNVRAWSLSCLHEAAPGQDDGSASSDCPPTAQIPAVRGAGFKTPLEYGKARVSVRVPLPPGTDTTDDDVGFRVVKWR